MTTVGYATLGIIPEVKGLARDLDRQTSGDLAAAGRKGGKRFGDEAGREASAGFKSRMSSSLKGFNPLAGLAVGAGAVALFTSAIGGASDLAESGSKVDVVFGDAATSVRKFGDDASSSIGQSEAQALSAVGTFGNLLRSVGLTEEASAKLSTSMVGLASDLASFNNTSIDEALEALRSGLVGETEPLKKFGVNMNEAVLKAKALELGLSNGKDVLDSNAKAQAAYAVIMEQTTLAQGDFARTAGGLANQQKTLSAQWSEMSTTVGQELLPATTGFVSFMNDKGLPALSATGGAVNDAAQAFGALPAPIQAAAGAFAALKIASSFGLTDAISVGASRAGSSLDGLRIRTMLARDAFVQARSASITLSGSMAGVSLGAGRATAGLAAVRAGAIGAGAAMRGFGVSAAAALGGPWGIALIAGTVALTSFMTRQDEARQKIEGLTDSLNKQTGELTKNTRSVVAQALEERGLLEHAEALGVGLDLVTNAALGSKQAIDELANLKGLSNNFELVDESGKKVGDSLSTLVDGIRDVAKETAGAQDEALRLAAANKTSADATKGSIGSLSEYRGEITKVRTELQKLIDKEQKRTLAAIQSQRDELALVSTMAATRKEAREGARTLDINTKAGRENKAALLDLADQWANSTPKARAAIGGYEAMRDMFVKVADSMGITKDQANKLADQLLKVPKTAPLKFQSEGFKERMAEIQRLKDEAAKLRNAFRIVYSSQASAQQSELSDRRFATGGFIGGRGTGTSDSNLIWASKGEFMQRKAAVDYYGVEFMRRLNALQIPKFAQGGPMPAASVAAPVASAPMFDFRGSTIQAHDYRDFMEQTQRRSAMSGMDRVNRR